MKRIQRLLSMLLVCCIVVGLLPTIALATEPTSGTCGENLTWTFENGTLIISGSGEMENYSNSDNNRLAPWYSYSISSITTVKISHGVTSIGDNAFGNCMELTSVSIPNSVTSIGELAFAGCRVLPNVTIPNSVTSIGAAAFQHCYGLTSVTIPNSVTSMGVRVFEVCTSLTSVTIPSSITSIEADTFSSCESLMNVTIPSSVTNIGDRAFANCYSLTHMTIPNGVTNIGSSAFYGCNKMTSVTLPSSITGIGDYAFTGHTSLKDVYFTGSESQWAAISIGPNNPLLYSATIHYNSTGSSAGETANTNGVYLEDLECTAWDRYTGNSGDSFIDTVGTRNSTTGVNGTTYSHGLEAWVARWNFTNEISWVWKEWEISSVYNLLSGEISLSSDCYTVKYGHAFTTNIEIIGDGKVLYSQTLTSNNANYPIEISIPLADVKTLRISLKDSVGASGGTSFILGDFMLSNADDVNPGEDVKDTFDVDIYRAKWLSKDADTAMILGQKTPSQIISDQVSGTMEPTAALWKSFTECFDALDDISTVADLAVEKKDMYTAIILTALESSYSLDVLSSEYKDYMSLSSSFIGSVSNTMKGMYAIDIMQSGNLQKLTTDQQETLEEVSGEWFKENFSTQYNVGQVFNGFQNAIKIMGNIEDFYEYMVSMTMLNTMRDDLKAVVRKAAELSKMSGNLDLVLAFADCTDTIDRSVAQLFEKIYTHELTVVGKETVGYLVGELWNEVTSELYASCPEAYVLMLTYKVGRYITDKVFSTNKIIEKYLKMTATLDVEEMMIRTYIELGAEFLDSMNADTAKAYLSGMDVMYNLRDGDCTAAYNYVDEVDEALVNKILQAFGKKNYDELKEAINSTKAAYKTNHYASTWDWIVNLDVDYPSSGLYEHYSALALQAALYPDKEIRVSCPVDVYVYDRGDNLVAYVEGEVVSGCDNLTIAKIGDEKVIRFFGAEDYRIEYVGYDTGDMDITITEFDSSKNTIRTVNYYDLALADEKAYSMDVAKETLKPYSLADKTDNITVKYDYDSMGATTKHTVKVISGILQQNGELFVETTASKGETLQLDAYVPEGYEFVRWETSNETALVDDSSSVSTTMIMADEDIIATAIMRITATGKTTVSISNVSPASGLTYTGAPQQGYTGTPTSTYTGEYDILYTGRNGTEYNSTTPPTDAGDYTVTIKVPDNDATYAGSIALEFTIVKATQSAPAAPEMSSKTSTVVSLKAVDANSNGTTAEYSKDGGTTWQSSPTFTGLSANTEYTFVVRYSEAKNYAASEASAALKVRTSSSSSTTTPTTPSGPSYNPGSTYVPPTYNITTPSVTGGKISVNPTSASFGSTVTITTTPDAGYELTSLTVSDASGKTIDLTDKGSGQYSFKMPNGRVSIDAEFSPVGIDVPWNNPFVDVSIGDWYYDAVKFAHQNGLMNGVGNGLFAPGTQLSRAMLAEILYNKEGRPAVTSGSTFADVQPSAWYADAVAWASGNSIVNGYGNGLFGPNDDITREQVALMLYRYAGSPAATDKELHFADAYKVSAWAQDAVRWAVDQGILNGKGNGILDPTGKATRAEAAQMLKNYLEK